MGGHGKQWACFTDTRFDWVPATAPGGGGFGCETYSLQYLFKEYERGNNRWTSSNTFYDLVRFTGSQFKFFRHKHIDFIVEYILTYPMKLDKYTYPYCHPYEMLKHRRHRIIPSWKSKPYGKPYVRIRIKPPKQMTTTWQFQSSFASKPLVQINTAAADINYSFLGCCNTNRLITFYALNLDMYTKDGWGNQSLWGTHGYQPYGSAPTTRTEYVGTTLSGKKLRGYIDASSYQKSISYEDGWFQPNLLQIAKFSTTEGHYIQSNIPITAGRYNVTLDTGQGNKVWFSSILASSFTPPSHDKDLILEDLPLWQAIYGFADYVQKIKGDETFLKSYVLVLQSPYIYPKLKESQYWVVIDKTFIKGEGPYSEYVTLHDKQKWFPTVQHQQQTMNAFVQSGPYIPKLENQSQSTWELKSFYTFYFKWGGAQPPDPEAADPSKQESFTPPGMQSETIQISDPTQQIPSTIIHNWDYRRGVITKRAFKRMLQDQETLSALQTDSEPPTPKKKKYSENTLQAQTQENKEIQACLQDLFKENIFQESQDPTDLQQLINNQREQQQQLKLHLLQLISDLKYKQRQIQLHTGLLD